MSHTFEWILTSSFLQTRLSGKGATSIFCRAKVVLTADLRTKITQQYKTHHLAFYTWMGLNIGLSFDGYLYGEQSVYRAAANLAQLTLTKSRHFAQYCSYYVFVYGSFSNKIRLLLEIIPQLARFCRAILNARRLAHVVSASWCTHSQSTK